MSQAYDQDEVRKAFDTIKAAMQADCPEERGSYAHSWHCNIAMMCYDAIRDHEISGTEVSGELQHEDAYKIANASASRFMKMCFDVDTKAE